MEKANKTNVFKELKMKMKDGVGEGSEHNVGICERVKKPLRKRYASVCYVEEEEPDEKRERRGRSVPIEHKVPIVLRIKKDPPACSVVSASPLPAQSIEKLNNCLTTDAANDLTLGIQGLKNLPKKTKINFNPKVNLCKLKLKTYNIEQVRSMAKAQELYQNYVQPAKKPSQSKVSPAKKKKT